MTTSDKFKFRAVPKTLDDLLAMRMPGESDRVRSTDTPVGIEGLLLGLDAEDVVRAATGLGGDGQPYIDFTTVEGHVLTAFLDASDRVVEPVSFGTHDHPAVIKAANLDDSTRTAVRVWWGRVQNLAGWQGLSNLVISERVERARRGHPRPAL